ncbi:MAG: ATP-binding protein [Gemmatimonadaceae bacterium]
MPAPLESTALIDSSPTRPPWVDATMMAGSYLMVAAAYILASSDMASTHTRTVEDLRRVEILKGLAFVAVTALALFAVNLIQLQRLRRRDERLRRMDRALHNAERSVLAGTFASTVAHDINNGLMVATLALDELHASVGQPSLKRLVADARTAIARIGDWNRRVFDLGGSRLLGEVRDFDLAQSIRTSCTLAGRHRSMRAVTLELEIPSATPFRGTEAIVQRAVLNLLLNAAEAAGPLPKLRLSMQRLEDGGYQIAVDDSGPGVPKVLRARILEPFFTTKEDGTGLGLASVVACANLHDGTVQIHDSPLGGARFTLILRATGAHTLTGWTPA